MTYYTGGWGYGGLNRPFCMDGSSLGKGLYMPNGGGATTVWYDAGRLVTATSDQKISAIGDRTGGSVAATQGTDANRPYLTRGDNLENRTRYTYDISNAWWSSFAATRTWPTAQANPRTGLLTVGSLIENSGTSSHSMQPNTSPSAPAEYTISTGQKVISECIVKRLGSRHLQLNVQDRFSGAPSANFDLINGTVQATANGGAGYIESLGGDWFFIRLTSAAATSSGVFRATYLLLDASFAASYTGDGTSGFYIDEIQVRIEGTDSGYLSNNGACQIASFNGNRAGAFLGAQSLATTLAVNPTGGMWGWAVVRPNVVAGTYSLFGARNNNATDRLRFIISAGVLGVAVMNGSTAYIGRATPIAAIVNTDSIFFFTYDGGTVSSGVEIYSGLTQIDNSNFETGVYTVPTAGASLVLGGEIAGASSLLNGLAPSFGFSQGNTISDANRIAWTLYLSTKFGIAIPPYIVKNIFAQSVRIGLGTSNFGTGSGSAVNADIYGDGILYTKQTALSGSAGRSFNSATITLDTGWWEYSFYVDSFTAIPLNVFIIAGGTAVISGSTTISGANVTAGGLGRYSVKFQVTSAGTAIHRLGVGVSGNETNKDITFSRLQCSKLPDPVAVCNPYSYPFIPTAYGFVPSLTKDANNKVTESSPKPYRLKNGSVCLMIGDSKTDEISDASGALDTLLTNAGLGVCYAHAKGGWTTLDMVSFAETISSVNFTFTFAQALSGKQMRRTYSTAGLEQVYSNRGAPINCLIINNFGVNDVNGGVSVADTISRLTSFIDAAQAASMKVIISNINPWKASVSWSEGEQTVTLELNAAIQALATARNLPFVNAYSLLGDAADSAKLSDGTSTSPNYSQDGLHPNAAGSTLIAEQYFNIISNF